MRAMAMRSAMMMAVVVGSAAGASVGQTSVDLRFVERTGQAQVASSDGVNSADAVLDIAVQARVNGGGALAGYQFDIVISGEPDVNGVLAREKIANPDWTYYSGYAVPGPGVFGYFAMPPVYAYYANVAGNPYFGSINISFGTFTNSPANQEMGLITASAATLGNVPGVDPAQEGNPATWSGYGTGSTPSAGATAAIDPAIGAAYFGMGQYVDIYRLRYTVTNFSARNLRFTLRGVTLQTATQFVYSNFSWRLNDAVWSGGQHTVNWAGPVNITELVIPVVVGNVGACCDVAGACTLVVQGACPAGSDWAAGGTCAAPCVALGSCCDVTMACVTASAANCGTSRLWTAGAVCVPNACPPAGACCTSAGACSVKLSAFCETSGSWISGAVCAPNPCPQPGACCVIGSCYVTLAAACGSIYPWSPGTCTPNQCAPAGACCFSEQACGIRLKASCPPPYEWIENGTCPCPTVGACCLLVGGCQVVAQAACAGQFHHVSSCLTPGVPAPCCAADFNGSGSVTVADIFDYVRAWFAGGPYVDMDGNGVSVGDIMRYLGMWFGGC